ncbi:MAG: dihydrolipoyl dehydrogenase [Candidatus Bipolaricaulota bacterium]|nr:dihydrolipoyl dehydrogenase [Candidatus Bipolaricaulota bacterium]
MAYDALIIGGGPGGYVCALRSAQLGLKVALVEEQELGGVCLHWGCIPTKALYAATRLMHQAATAGEMGIAFAPPTLDLPSLAAWKGSVTARLAGGIVDLMKAADVDVVRGRGRLVGPGEVAVSTGGNLRADWIVLATGSRPIEINGFPFSHPRVWSSDDALRLDEIPQRLAVIGGGVIGVELAAIYRQLGSEVSVVELLPDILAALGLDRRATAVVKRGLTAAGVRILNGVSAASFAEEGDGLTITLSDGSTLGADRVLVGVGRRPNSSDLGLDKIGVEPDRRGAIPVSGRCETSAPGVYAIGDVVPGPMLAHKASADGIVVAHAMAGDTYPATPADLIPQVVFTDPEVASIGLSEAAARAAGRNTVVGRFAYAALGKALGMRETEGFFQVVASNEDHRILGVTIVGAEASDLLAEGALAVRHALTLEQVAETVHAHPTLPEGFHEAVENALGRGIHTTRR